MMPVAILAGGLGTRLGAETATIPKALVKVGPTPFLFLQLRMLQQQGVDHVVVCTGHLGDQIERAVDSRRHLFSPMRIDISSDGEELLGTAGALRNALPLLGKTFFVLYGDVLFHPEDCNLVKVEVAFKASRKPALMASYPRMFGDGNVRIYPDHVEYDKSQHGNGYTHLDFGVGVMTAYALSEHPASDLADVYREIGADLAGIEIDRPPFEIGSPDGLHITRWVMTG